VRVARRRAAAQHQGADDQHQHGEQGQQLLPVHGLAQAGAQRRPDHARRREQQGDLPLHRPVSGVVQQIGEGVGRHGEGAGADGQVRILHAYQIDDQRHGQDRAAPAHQAQGEADQRPRPGAQAILQKAEGLAHHAALVRGATPGSTQSGAQSHSRPFSIPTQ